MRWLILSLCVIMTACGSEPNPQAQDLHAASDSDSVQKKPAAPVLFKATIDSLPPALKSCISQLNSPDTLDENRWEKNWREMYHSDSVRVNRLFADFDGNGFPDYAMMLQNANRQIFVYVFLAADQGKSYNAVVLDTLSSGASGPLEQGLDIMPRGKYTDEFGEMPGGRITLTYPGITVNFFEKAAVTYYWDGKSFTRFYSAD